MKNTHEKLPHVSVLMPAYNTEKYIEKAIKSILEQTFKDFEFIIIDDCSTDETWNIIKKIQKNDKRIICIHHQKNVKIPATRNELVMKAQGAYIAWQDADDISMPDRLELQFSHLEKNPTVGIVGGFLEFFDENGSKSIRKYASDDATLRKNIFRYSPVAQPAAMIRKDVFKKVGLYDEKYTVAQDLDMSFRIGTYYEFANIPKVLLKYREHGKSATFSRLKDQLKNTLEIRRKYAANKQYKYAFSDKCYNLAAWGMLFFPSPVTNSLFKLIRNEK